MSPEKDSIIKMICRRADDASVPRELLLALCKSESNLNAQAERWAYLDKSTYKHVNLTAAAQSAIQHGDIDGVQRIINACVSHGSTDISFGIAQQAYRWSSEWAGWNASDVLKTRAKYFNVEYALSVAASKVKTLFEQNGGDLLLTLCRYNKPQGTPTQEVIDRYRGPLEWAKSILQGEDRAMFEFVLGFKELADRLGAEVVGEPVEDEQDLGDLWRVQTTTKGVMWYSKVGNVAHFFPAAR